MPAEDWERLDALAAAERAAGEPTDARARGAALSRLIAATRAKSTPHPVPRAASAAGTDWLEWEMQKLRRLA